MQDPSPRNLDGSNTQSKTGSTSKQPINILNNGVSEPKHGRITHPAELYNGNPIAASSAHDFSKKTNPRAATNGNNLDIFKPIPNPNTRTPGPFDKGRTSAATTTKFLDDQEDIVRTKTKQKSTIEEWER